MGLNPKFCIFERAFSDKMNISDNFLLAKNLGGAEQYLLPFLPQRGASQNKGITGQKAR